MKCRGKTLLLITLAIGCFCGCGGSETKDANTIETEMSSTEQETDISEGTSDPETVLAETDDSIVETSSETHEVATGTLSSLYVTEAHEFSEGVAWVDLSDENENPYIGLIDKTGKLLFYYAGSFITREFSDGYGYIQNSEKGLFRVNQSGEIVSRYPADEYKIVAYGDGYVVNEEYASGFDEAQYTYSVLDISNNVITDFKADGTRPITELYALDKDAFYFHDYERYGEGKYFYLAKSDKWIENNVAYDELEMRRQKFNDGILVYMCGSYGEDYFISYFDAGGNQFDVYIPEEYGDLKVIGYSGDTVAFVNSDQKEFVLYNISTDNFTKYEGEYLDSIYWEEQSMYGYTQPCAFDDNTLVIPLQGKDGGIYFSIIDTSTMKEKCEPILLGREDQYMMPMISIEGGVIRIYDFLGGGTGEVSLYDLEGNLINTYARDTTSYLSEGILIFDRTKYLKYDGTPAFGENGEIDMTESKMLSIE